ncbi:MAG TPA: hypothetical protein VFR67_14825, partial [Pilimelia sp.]|nr:hypothetical protein [Pilimelia sp.]
PPPEPAVAALGPAGRSPEQIRAMMSSFQAGTVRGRRDATEDWFLPAGAPAPLTPAPVVVERQTDPEEDA